jgi:hypothetical protein
MKLVFKKAFGIEVISADVGFWMMELGSKKYSFQSNDYTVEISRGSFGGSQQEAREIDRYVSPHRRPIGHAIPTLDVALDILNGVSGVPSPTAANETADVIVRPYIATAWHAVRRFIEIYRDTKYIKYRHQDRWRLRQTLLPRITEHEFRTWLFYVLVDQAGETFVGSFSEGESMIGEFSIALQEALSRRIVRRRKICPDSVGTVF